MADKEFSSRMPNGVTITTDIEEWDTAWKKWDEMLDHMGYKVISFDPGIRVVSKERPNGRSVSLEIEILDAIYEMWEWRYAHEYMNA